MRYLWQNKWFFCFNKIGSLQKKKKKKKKHCNTHIYTRAYSCHGAAQVAVHVVQTHLIFCAMSSGGVCEFPLTWGPSPTSSNGPVGHVLSHLELGLNSCQRALNYHCVWTRCSTTVSASGPGAFQLPCNVDHWVNFCRITNNQIRWISGPSPVLCRVGIVTLEFCCNIFLHWHATFT
jgi:hypothetical protein